MRTCSLVMRVTCGFILSSGSVLLWVVLACVSPRSSTWARGVRCRVWGKGARVDHAHTLNFLLLVAMINLTISS